jgi:hypothetical protein
LASQCCQKPGAAGRLCCGALTAAVMVLAGCDREPPPEPAALTPAQQAIAGLRQSLAGTGRWEGGAMRITAPAVRLGPDNSLILESRPDQPVTLCRLSRDTGDVTVEFRARQVHYVPITSTTVRCRLHDVRTTNPQTGQPITMPELHFEFTAEALAQ